jgi:DNA-binding PadR family transcriptional regulator
MDDNTSWFGGRFFRRPPVPPGPPGAPPMPPGVPPPPPGWPFGPNPWLALVRRRARARRGDVRSAILALLGEQPRNGYQIIQELEQRSHGSWRPSPGAVYPALQQLEDEGLIRVDTEGGGRVFHLTDRGRTAGAAREDEPPPWEATATGAADGRAALMEAIRQLMGAAGQVTQSGTPAQIAAAQRAVHDARRALYRILAEDDVDQGGGDGDDGDDGDDDE